MYELQFENGAMEMSSWKDDGDYWTQKGRIHHGNGGRYIVSVKKNTNYVLESEIKKHGKTNHKGAR